MADIGLFWDDTFAAADLGLLPDDIQQDGGLETAVLLSLFTDRREGTERGWWGDAVPAVSGDAWGSRLWTLSREKDTARVLQRAEELAREALAWLLEDKVASQVDVTAQSLPVASGRSALLLTVTIHRPSKGAVTYQYDYNWAAQAARRS